MGVISFRVPDDDEKRLRGAGINPASLAKEHVEQAARRLRLGERAATLEKHRKKPSFDVLETIRSGRA